MCFSPTADLVAGLFVGVVGVDCLRHVGPARQLPLAVLPLVFAVHQVVEAFVWWGLQGHVPAMVGERAAWLYLVIAFGVVPVLVPVAVARAEPEPRRSRMTPFVVVGAVVAASLTYAVVRGPIVTTIEGRHVAYELDLWHGGVMTALYVLATCGSMLLSAHRHVRVYGAVNLVVVVLLAWLDQNGFISLWCVWAAVTSVAIAVHLRAVASEPRPGPAAPVTPTGGRPR